MRWPRSSGMLSVDAPVSGGTGGAKGATLTFMGGGEDKAFAAAKPVLENMGKKIVHCGDAGAGQAAKICNNMILGISMIGVGEAFALGGEARPVASGAVRRRLDLLGPVLVADVLLPGAGPGADLAGQQRLQAGLRLGADGEGPRRWRRTPPTPPGAATPLGKHAQETLQGVRRRRPWRGGFFRDYPARSESSPGNNGDLMTTFPGRARLSAQAPHRLRCGREGLSLARSGSVQLGAGLVRCRTCPQSRQPGPRRALDRRCRPQGDKALLCGTVAPFQPGRELPACAGR